MWTLPIDSSEALKDRKNLSPEGSEKAQARVIGVTLLTRHSIAACIFAGAIRICGVYAFIKRGFPGNMAGTMTFVFFAANCECSSSRTISPYSCCLKSSAW